MKTCRNTRASIGLVLILCAAPLGWAGAASAEPAGTTPGAATDGLPPHEIFARVRASGFDPVSRPLRSGRTFTLRALDRYDAELTLVVDARTGRVLSASEVAAPRYAARRGPMPAYGAYETPVYARIFGSPEAGFGSPRPPRVVPGAQGVPSGANVKPQEQAGAQTPLPRPRPYVVEATGSVPAAADMPVAQANPAPAPETSQKQNGGASMPPIAPLD
ncbi:MAG TPA: hypothetical protein VH249_07635 [Xanthobacteraceae bacterium]|nr:hypothetical protein [Xanthobacteraceae bacterium]